MRRAGRSQIRASHSERSIGILRTLSEARKGAVIGSHATQPQPLAKVTSRARPVTTTTRHRMLCESRLFCVGAVTTGIALQPPSSSAASCAPALLPSSCPADGYRFALQPRPASLEPTESSGCRAESCGRAESAAPIGAARWATGAFRGRSWPSQRTDSRSQCAMGGSTSQRPARDALVAGLSRSSVSRTLTRLLRHVGWDPKGPVAGLSTCI